MSDDGSRERDKDGTEAAGSAGSSMPMQAHAGAATTHDRPDPERENSGPASTLLGVPAAAAHHRMRGTMNALYYLGAMVLYMSALRCLYTNQVPVAMAFAFMSGGLFALGCVGSFGMPQP